MKELIERHYKENFNKLVKAYSRKAGSVENAEDIVQEAFSLALRYSDSYDERYCNFKAWFDRILFNAFRLKMKEERRLGMTEEIDEDLIEQEELNLTDKVTVERLREEMDKRSPHIAEQLNLFFFKEYGVKQVSLVTGLPFRTVDSTINRFKNEMRAKYEVKKEGGRA